MKLFEAFWHFLLPLWMRIWPLLPPDQQLWAGPVDLGSISLHHVVESSHNTINIPSTNIQYIDVYRSYRYIIYDVWYIRLLCHLIVWCVSVFLPWFLSPRTCNNGLDLWGQRGSSAPGKSQHFAKRRWKFAEQRYFYNNVTGCSTWEDPCERWRYDIHVGTTGIRVGWVKENQLDDHTS